jgi:hypothetical protein
MRLGTLVPHGASPGDVVEEERNPRKPAPTDRSDGREVTRSFKRERLQRRMNLHRQMGGTGSEGKVSDTARIRDSCSRSARVLPSCK